MFRILHAQKSVRTFAARYIVSIWAFEWFAKCLGKSWISGTSIFCQGSFVFLPQKFHGFWYENGKTKLPGRSTRLDRCYESSFVDPIWQQFCFRFSLVAFVFCKSFQRHRVFTISHTSSRCDFSSQSGWLWPLVSLRLSVSLCFCNIQWHHASPVLFLLESYGLKGLRGSGFSEVCMLWWNNVNHSLFTSRLIHGSGRFFMIPDVPTWIHHFLVISGRLPGHAGSSL